MEATQGTEPVRLDRWLWAARFFKSRSLASEAVTGGRVQLTNGRAKPARAVHVGDEVIIAQGPYERRVIVLATSSRRGPASAAQNLYEETEESRSARERLALERAAHADPLLGGSRRPSKKDRRVLARLRSRSRA